MQDQLNDAYLNRIKASMIDSFMDFISIADTSRKIIYYNPAAYRMMGYEPDESPDIMTTEKLHAKGFDKFAKEVIQPSVFEKGSWTGISYINHKDGSPITVEMTVFPLYGKNGEEYGTVAVMRDVNELAKMNERLKKSSELFQKVLDSAKIGIVLINMRTNSIEMINKWTSDMLRMEPNEIIGKKCYDILCRRSLDLCPHVNERDKQVLVAERYLERKDGSFLPIIKTGTWITIDDTEYLVDTLVDITIQKELEQKLQVAKTAAEAASHSKTEFLSRMSHEMRTPLNAIIGMTRLSEKTDSVEKLKQCMETIKLSSNHLLSLINDILDLSKIEADKLELSLEPFSVADLARDTAALIDPKVREKNIRLQLAVDERIPPLLMGDPLRLSQVLLNFLSNAVKFTPENGEVRFTAALNSRGETGVNLHFAVSDTGIGIPEDQLARLFNPFAQADDSITRKYGGTGLGLVISKRIINLMGSDIEVATRPGKGSTFRFALDLLLVGNADIAPHGAEDAPADIAGIFRGKKALIVDDVDVNRLIAVELLAETGLEFDEAENGRVAVDKATRNHYDAVLMDIQMPVMDGYEATRRIRQAAKPFSDAPIIAMSANVFKEDVERSLAAGMNAHVGKPIDVDKVVLAIHRLVHGAGAEKTGETAAKAAFRPDIGKRDFDKNYFNFALALQLHGGDEFALAALCREFLHNDRHGTLKTALERKDYATAEKAASLLLEEARDLCLTSLTAYVGNVAACLERKAHEYAVMYANDLEKCHVSTREILEELLAPDA